MDKFCNDLMGATQGARKSGVDSLNVLHGLVGTIALSIKASGGDDRDIADVLRTCAEGYDERAHGQHCTPMRYASVG